MPKTSTTNRSQRPKPLTVFAAAFVAGAVAAVGINRALDIHLAQAKPQVECEPIFVALRDLPQGSTITIWDVALRDWPKAMLPTTALRADDRFEGMLVKHPVREGQPLLSVQLTAAEARSLPPPMSEQVVEIYEPRTFQPAPALQPDADLWASAADPATHSGTASQQPPTAPQASETLVAGQDAASEEEAAAESTIAAPMTTDVASSVESTPTVVEDTPLLAVEEPSPVASTEPDPVASMDPAPMVEPVQPDATPAEPETTPVQPVATTPKRYLVVPERIAVQAEASFTMPVPQPNAASEPVEPAPALVVEQSQATSPVAMATGPQSESQTEGSPVTPNQSQAKTTPKRSATKGPTAQPRSVPRVAQAPTLETHPNTEPQQPVSAFDGLFPNLRATFGASGKPQPEQQNKQPSRTARWPWSSGR